MDFVCSTKVTRDQRSLRLQVSWQCSVDAQLLEFLTHQLQVNFLNAMVTCEINLFRNYFSLCRRPSEIILFRGVETCLKLFQNYFTGLLQLMNIFQHVQCCWNNFEIIQNSLSGWNNFMSVSDVVMCEIKHWNNFQIIVKNYCQK